MDGVTALHLYLALNLVPAGEADPLGVLAPHPAAGFPVLILIDLGPVYAWSVALVVAPDDAANIVKSWVASVPGSMKVVAIG